MLFFRNYRRLCVYVDNIKRIKYHKVVMCLYYKYIQESNVQIN